ncbi:hypothetical protein ACQR3P_18425 [Rhodococcus sp. IEGM1300]
MKIKPFLRSQKSRNGGLSKPIIKTMGESWTYGFRSQCFAFQRLKASLIFFMPGLHDRRFVWKQNDITVAPGTYPKAA